MSIGSKIKTLRSLQNVTLEELSKRTGLSVSFHSQLERERVSPSISSLQKIAEALSTTAGHFFDKEENQSLVIVKKAGIKKITVKEKEIFFQRLASGFFGLRIMPLLLSLEIGAKLTEDLFHARGDIFGMIIVGTLELLCEKENLILEEGDSIYCNRSQVPQQITNIGNIQAQLIWIIFL